MKATKMTVTWVEKVRCRETVTVRWVEVMDHLNVPEDEREDYEVTDEEVMDYLFDDDVQLLEHSLSNEIDYDLLDSDCSDVSVVDVEPRPDPRQPTLPLSTDVQGLPEDWEEDDRNQNPEAYGETFDSDHTA